MLSSAKGFATADSAPREHELKLLLESRRTRPALDCLGSLCRSDSRHPANLVLSVYYDTRQLTSLDEKLNSDRFKSKVRLRWYEDLFGGPRSEKTFLEVKYRLGRQRQKQRTETPFAADQLAALPLSDALFEGVLSLLQEARLSLPSPLVPLLLVKYRRARFVDPLSGSRISVDSDIQALRVNRRVWPAGRPAPVAGTVVEVKNRSGQIPEHLRVLGGLGARQGSFSKYAACYHAALSGAG